MAKRLTRKLTDVAREVETQLKAHFDITQNQIEAWRTAAKTSHQLNPFPESKMVAVADLWIDYEVQRDVLHKHIINIMKKWDARICSPVSACQLLGLDRIDTYDGQHRSIAAAILGFTSVPCAVVLTTDKNFASYAFEMLNDTGVKRLTPGDLHRNALVRFKNGSRDIKVVRARTMQDQFDAVGIDLQDKGSRNSDNLRGDSDYFFSHFKYAQKGIELDQDQGKGEVLFDMLTAIKETFPLQEEIDQGVFIGLYELRRIAGAANITLPAGWMKEVLDTVKQTFKSSSLVHAKARVQWEHKNPGATWSAPSAMANFLRELYIRNGGKLELPYHGEGATMGVLAGNVAPGLFPQEGV
jgi:hypothetical protein